jgi:hypothetical protein
MDKRNKGEKRGKKREKEGKRGKKREKEGNKKNLLYYFIIEI